MTTTARKYTPEQVSALSDRDLSEAVARDVFGVPVHTSWGDIGDEMDYAVALGPPDERF